MKSAVVLEPAHRCSTCFQARRCLPNGLRPVDVESLDEIMHLSRPIRTGGHLFRAGDPLKAVYAIRSGCFKSTIADCDGGEHVLGFYLPSELIGLEAVYSGRHLYDAVALTTSRVCVLPYYSLMRLASGTPTLLARMFGLFSKDIGNQLAQAGDFAADERLAAFLVGIGRRMHPAGARQTRITLPMSRTDIASHLRLAPATLSRTLARLQQEKVIRVDRRSIHVLNPDKLEESARRVPPVSI